MQNTEKKEMEIIEKNKSEILSDKTTCCASSCCEDQSAEAVRSAEEIKKSVHEKYTAIAKAAGSESCCGTSCCENEDTNFSILTDEYHAIEGYESEADLGLGCGLPTEYAGIHTGNVVLDLGSGAGNDVFVARKLVGETGQVIGVDFSEAMIEKAQALKEKRQYKNVEFRLGDIEDLPVADNAIDVVVSNCVLNLVPDKQKAFQQIFRVLKPGGHFSVSDIVIKGAMSLELQNSAALYAGCISGALQQDEYLQIIKEAGFVNVEIRKSQKIELPEDLLKKYLSAEGVDDYHQNIQGIYSITVNGFKQ